MESRLYDGIPAVDVSTPEGDGFDAIHSAYVTMATSGRATHQRGELFFSIGKDLCKKQHAEVVVLAGTDLSLHSMATIVGFLR